MSPRTIEASNERAQKAMNKSVMNDALEAQKMFNEYQSVTGATADILRSINEISAARKMIDCIEREEALIRSFHENSAIQRMIESIERDNALMRSFLGPCEDLRRAGIFDANPPWHREMERARQLTEAFEAR